MKDLLQKIRSFFTSPSHSRTLALLGVLLLIGAIGLTATVVQQQTNTKQHANTVYSGTCQANSGRCAILGHNCPNGFTSNYTDSPPGTLDASCTGPGDSYCCVPNNPPPAPPTVPSCSSLNGKCYVNNSCGYGMHEVGADCSAANNGGIGGRICCVAGNSQCLSHGGLARTPYPQCGQPFASSNPACPYDPDLSHAYTIYPCADGSYVCTNQGQVAGQCNVPTPPPTNACSDPYKVTQGWGQGDCTSLSSICVLNGNSIPPNFVDGHAGCTVNIENSQSLGFPFFATNGECWNYKNPSGGTNNLWNHTQAGTQGSCTAPGSICWNSLPILPDNGSKNYTKANVNCVQGALPGECFNYSNSAPNQCLGNSAPTTTPTNTPTPTTASSGGGTTGICSGHQGVKASGSYPQCSQPFPSSNPACPVDTDPTHMFTIFPCNDGTFVCNRDAANDNQCIPQPYLNLAINLPGISNIGADSVIGNNNSPKHNTRVVHVQVFKVNDNAKTTSPVINANVTLTYNPATGNFENSHAGLGKGLPDGQYQIFLKTAQSLRKRHGGATTTYSLSNNQTTTLAPITLLSGDYLNKNTLDLLTYNAGVTSCYADLATTSTCAIGLQQADLNDDGVVDGIDYNIFLRSLNSFGNTSADGEGAGGN